MGRVPQSTYRWQFHAGFTFHDASEWVPYLAALGIDTCYASPLLQARAGSPHGYDVTDFKSFSEELGGEAGFARFHSALRVHQLGLLLDMVPNHMGIHDPRNAWWEDVLEHGSASPCARYFDILWHTPGLEGQVLVPILGEPFGTVLEAGQLQLIWTQGRLRLQYFDRTFPISAAGYGLILDRLLAGRPFTGREAVLALRHELESPEPLAVDTVVQLKDRWARWLEGCSADARAAWEETLALLNGVLGKPASFDVLQGILDVQHYRLAHWRLASFRLNYRRFFDINDLAGLRMEEPEVFVEAHRLVAKWMSRGAIAGLRIDHPDGLWDPAGYFQNLQRLGADALGQQEGAASAEGGTSASAIYVVAEKILAADEPLPEDWALDGTSGYDFLNLINGIFVDPAGESTLDELYRGLAPGLGNYTEIVRASKWFVMSDAFRPEVDVLARRLQGLLRGDRHACDLNPVQVREGLMEWMAALSVYRTYLRPDRPRPTPEEARRVREAAEKAEHHRPELKAIFAFLTLLFTAPPPPEEEAAWTFLMRLQQLTGPVMAKGVEDTAFYRYNRLISLNEVGGEPGSFGCSLDWFHDQNARRRQGWPHSMLATTTHDTKRSEDVRARLNVLSELATEWAEVVARWRKKTKVATSPAGPEANTEYLIFQTLVGVWPMQWPNGAEWEILRERVWRAMQKSVREAKLHTSWVEVNQPYEEAVHQYVQKLFSNLEEFLPGFRAWVEKVSFFGRWNSLSQLVLKATGPGVPDFYQGCELWDLSLVDPDNRRPVNFQQRRDWLEEMRGHPDARSLASRFVAEAADGRIKLFITWHLLQLRQRQAQLFALGEYLPLRARGPRAEHVVAFARRSPGNCVVVVVPRWTAKLTGGRLVPPVGEDLWRGTTVPVPAGGPDRMINVFTGETVSAQAGSWATGGLLRIFPVAVFASDS